MKKNQVMTTMLSEHWNISHSNDPSGKRTTLRTLQQDLDSFFSSSCADAKRFSHDPSSPSIPDVKSGEDTVLHHLAALGHPRGKNCGGQFRPMLEDEERVSLSDLKQILGLDS